MRKTRSLSVLALLSVAAAAGGGTGCMLKSTHCKLVRDLAQASAAYKQLADEKGSDGDKAVADQQKKTVEDAVARCQ